MHYMPNIPVTGSLMADIPQNGPLWSDGPGGFGPLGRHRLAETFRGSILRLESIGPHLTFFLMRYLRDALHISQALRGTIIHMFT
jgi:hypothetical protein